jgi:hypothetical protein
MFFFAALFVGAFILSAFFAPKPKIENARASSLSDFKFPRAKEGDPVPRGYGTYKTRGVNVIDQCDFEAEPIKKKVKTGLFSSKKQIVGYKYKIGLALGVALGPCVTFRRMFFGKHEVWNGCLTSCAPGSFTIDLPDLYGGQDRNGGVGGTVSFYPGTFDQPQDSYLVSKRGANVPAYVGIAYAVFNKFYFGNSANIEPISFEVAHFSNTLGIPLNKHILANGLDANPIEVLYDLYVNDWGNLNIDTSLIDDLNWIEAAETLYDENNGISVEIANPQQGAEVTKEILRQINGFVYQDPSTGLIRIKLLREDYDIETLPTYGPSEIKSVTNFTKKLWKDTFNRVRVKYTDRARSYKEDAVAVESDFANIRFQGQVRATEIAMPGVYVAELAQAIAARELANLNVPLFQAELVSDRSAVALYPGAVFKLSWPEYNIVSMVVRVRKFGLGTKDNGAISMFVIQDEFAIDATVYGVPAPNPADDEDYGPQDIEDYALFELPYFLTVQADLPTNEGYTYYNAFAAKPGAGSIDFFVMVEDGDDDIEVLSNAPYSENARLLSSIGKYAGFETGVIPVVEVGLITSLDTLEQSDAAGLRTGVNLCMIGNEFFAFETYVDNGSSSVSLLNVRRALLDTTYEAHDAGDVVFFFDGQEGFLEDELAVAPFDAYLLDRSIGGRSTEAGATVNELDPAPRWFLPAPPDYVELDGDRTLPQIFDAGASVDVSWFERNRLDAEIAFEDDATDADEAGTTYDIELRRVADASLVDDVIGAVSPESFAIPASTGTYDAEFWVYSVRDGERSFTPAVFPVTIVGSAAALRIVEEGDYRETEDGELRAEE